MQKSRIAKVVSGGILLLLGVLDRYLKSVESLDWLQTNAPKVFEAVTNPITEVSLFVCGFAILGFLLLQHFTSTHSASSVPARVNAQSVGEGNQLFSAAGDIHIHSNVGPAKSAEAPLTPRNKPEAATQPHLRYVNYKSTPLLMDKYQYDGMRDPRNAEEFAESQNVFVLKFENVLVQNGVGKVASDVIAKLTYYTSRTNFRVDYGVWLNAASRYIDIGIEETVELVALVTEFKDQDNSICAVMTDNRSSGSEFETPYAWATIDLIETPDRLTVELVSQRSLYKRTFDFALAYQRIPGSPPSYLITPRLLNQD